MHEQHDEEGKECPCGGACPCHQMHGPMRTEFKLAMIEKKEKMLQAKLEFIGKIKEMVKKMPTDNK